MFICQICGGVVPPRTPAARVVLRSRLKEYRFRSRANRFYRLDSNSKVKEHWSDDPGGSGWEIDREAIACPACAE